MSYILDALRKAERDRQVSRVPTLATSHASAELRRPLWIWIVAGALAVTAAAVYTFLWAPPRPGPVRQAGPPPAVAPGAPAAAASADPVTSHRPQEAPPTRDVAAVAPTPGPAVEQPPSRLAPATPRVAPVAPPGKTSTAARSGDARRGAVPVPGTSEASGPPAMAQADPAPPAAARPGVATPGPRAGGDPVGPAAVAAAPSPVPEAAPSGRTPPPPTPAQAPPALTPPLPAPVQAPPAPTQAAPASAQPLARLTLDVLVYSEVAAERLVFINGRKYVEGQAVEGDTIIEQITADGAILLSQGTRFILRPKLNPYARPGSP